MKVRIAILIMLSGIFIAVNAQEPVNLRYGDWDKDDSNFIDPEEYDEFDSFYLDI